MTIDSLVISGICMPFVSDTTSIVGLYGINSLDSTVYISFNVPMPDSGYVSGRSYKYDVLYDADTIVIQNVYVKPWKEVNEGTVIIN